jgi:hypothetical protein
VIKLRPAVIKLRPPLRNEGMDLMYKMDLDALADCCWPALLGLSLRRI